MSNSSNTTSSPSSQQQQQQVSFAREQHMRYIAHLDDVERDSFEYQVTEHLRMSGIYWALTALDLFILDGDQQQQQAAMMDREKVVQFVLQCHDERSGGFSGNTAHDPHLLYTLSAVQVLAVCRALDRIDRHQVAKCVCEQSSSFIHTSLLSSLLSSLLLHDYMTGWMDRCINC